MGWKSSEKPKGNFERSEEATDIDPKKELVDLMSENDKRLRGSVQCAFESNVGDKIQTRAIKELKKIYNSENSESEGKMLIMKAVGMYAVEQAQSPQDVLNKIYGDGVVGFEVADIPPDQAWQDSLRGMGVSDKVISGLEFYTKPSRYGGVPIDPQVVVKWAKKMEKTLGSLCLLTDADFNPHGAYSYVEDPDCCFGDWIEGLRGLGIPMEKVTGFPDSKSSFLKKVSPLEFGISHYKEDLSYLKKIKDMGVVFDSRNCEMLRLGLHNWANYNESENWPPLSFFSIVVDAGYRLNAEGSLSNLFELYYDFQRMSSDEITKLLAPLKDLSDKGFDWSALSPRVLFASDRGSLNIGKGVYSLALIYPDEVLSFKSKGGVEQDLDILLSTNARRNMQRVRGEGLISNFPDFDYSNFLTDPAMPYILGAMRFMSDAQKKSEWPLLVGRYLCNQKNDPAKASVAEALSTLGELIRSRRNVEVLGAERKVTVVANDELLDGSQEYRFGKPKLVEKIKQVTKQDPEVFRLKPDDARSKTECVAELKANILDNIKNSSVPRTFIFNGHGSWDGFELSTPSGLLTEYAKYSISYKEFAEALRVRYQNAKASSEEFKKDVFFFGACGNHNMIRALDEELKDVLYRPVFITSGEYGQVSYSDLDSENGSFIFDEVFQFKTGVPSSVTVGNFLDLQDPGDKTDASVSNISVFVPFSGRATQIGQNDKKNRPDVLPA